MMKAEPCTLSLRVMKLECIIVIRKLNSSREWCFENEELSTKVKRGRTVGKKIVASYLSRKDHIGVLDYTIFLQMSVYSVTDINF